MPPVIFYGTSLSIKLSFFVHYFLLAIPHTAVLNYSCCKTIVQKENCPIRPICSAVGTSTYQLSKYVADIIRPASVNSHGTDLKDTFQFLEQINGVQLDQYTMISYDVRSLFTNVPLKETIDITMDRLYRSDAVTPPAFPENVLQSLLELCVKDNVFVFNEHVYYQKDGVVMGNSLDPILADIFMSHLEETFIFSSDHIASFYRRYVDDTFFYLNVKRMLICFLNPSTICTPTSSSIWKLSLLTNWSLWM